MAKSDKYRLMEAFANSLKEERNVLFKEVIRLRGEIADLKEESRFLYIVQDYDGNPLSYYRNRDNAIKVIENNEKNVYELVESGEWAFTPEEEVKKHLFQLQIVELGD